jgi:hypothetical protein
VRITRGPYRNRIGFVHHAEWDFDDDRRDILDGGEPPAYVVGLKIRPVPRHPVPPVVFRREELAVTPPATPSALRA